MSGIGREQPAAAHAAGMHACRRDTFGQVSCIRVASAAGHQPMARGLHRALTKHQVPSVGWSLARLRQVLAFRLPVPFDLQAQCRGKKRREA